MTISDGNEALVETNGKKQEVKKSQKWFDGTPGDCLVQFVTWLFQAET